MMAIFYSKSHRVVRTCDVTRGLAVTRSKCAVIAGLSSAILRPVKFSVFASNSALVATTSRSQASPSPRPGIKTMAAAA